MIVNEREMMLLPERHLNTSEMQVVWNGGWTNKLVKAAAHGDFERVEALLPKTRDEPLRQLALEQATHHEHAEVVRYLLQSGVRSQASFVRACGGSSLPIVQAFVEHCRINDGCIIGETVGSIKKRWASRWRKDVWATPMYWACLKGNEPAVKFLLDRKAVITPEDVEAAKKNGDVQLVEALLQKVELRP